MKCRYPKNYECKDLNIGRRVGGKNFFIKESGYKPYGSVVQTNKSIDIGRASAVVPWTHIIFFQKKAGAVLGCKNTHGVYDSAKKKGKFFLLQFLRNGADTAVIN